MKQEQVGRHSVKITNLIFVELGNIQYLPKMGCSGIASHSENRGDRIVISIRHIFSALCRECYYFTITYPNGGRVPHK